MASPIHIRELTLRAGDASCFVSIAIENITNFNFTISSADFHPPQGLTTEMIGGPKCSGDFLLNDANHERTAIELFDDCGRLNPGESFRYLFLVKAASHDSTLRGIAVGDELGKAVFTWKRAMGEAGRIASASVICPPITHQPSTLISDDDGRSVTKSKSSKSNSKFVVHGSGLPVDVAVSAANNQSASSTAPDGTENNSLDEILPVTVEPIDPPLTMELGKPQKVQLLVVNHSNKTMNLQLQMRLSHMDGVVVCGSSFQNLGNIEPNGKSCVIGIRLLPLLAGLFRVQGCWIVEMTTAREIPQPPLFHVFVQKNLSIN